MAGGRCRPEQPAGASAPLAGQARSAASGPGRSSTGRASSRSSPTCRRRRLRIPYRKLARLHPAQIADIVEAASHEEGEEIIEAVKADRELEADVFEELDTEHQVEFVRTRSDADAARLLARMAPDDAADLIMELDQERRLPVLGLLPASQQRKVRSLLSYNPETAGGLMSPDFLALPQTTDGRRRPERDTAQQRSARVAERRLHPRRRRALSPARCRRCSLIRSRPDSDARARRRGPNPAHVHADWDVHSVVRQDVRLRPDGRPGHGRRAPDRCSAS